MPWPWILMYRRAADPYHTFGVRGINESPEKIHEVRVRRGPYLNWRAKRKLNRVMRGVQ